MRLITAETYSTDERVITAYAEKTFELPGALLKDHEGAVTVSVVASSGSAPRGAGARMLVSAKGRLYGTIGGGHVSQELVPALSADDFRCVVLEDKEDFFRQELFPGGVLKRGGLTTAVFWTMLTSRRRITP